MSAHLASTARRLRTRVHIITSQNGSSDLRWGWRAALPSSAELADLITDVTDPE